MHGERRLYVQTTQSLRARATPILTRQRIGPGKCECDTQINTCWNLHDVVKTVDGCERCTTDAQCPNAELPGCTYKTTPETNFCNSCILEKINTSIRECRKDGWTDDHAYVPSEAGDEKDSGSDVVTTEQPKPVEVEAPRTKTDYSRVSGDGDSKSEESSKSSTEQDSGSESAKGTATTTETDVEESPQPAEKCVSTKWVQDNGYGDAILRRGSFASVLCIPGLPCATAGHVVRSCEGGNCRLRTYKQVCETRSDCVESAMEVSQLSHQFDWSVVKSGDLRLTSLSMNANSSVFSISRTIAHLTDWLNSNGLGFVSDHIATSHTLFTSVLFDVVALPKQYAK